MPFGLGFFATAGAGGAGGVEAFDLLESVVLTDTSSLVSFTNINTNYGSQYKNLQVRVIARSNVSQNSVLGVMRINGSSTSSHYWQYDLYSEGFGVSSADSNQSNAGILYRYPGNSRDNGVFGYFNIDFNSAFDSTTYKSFVGTYGWIDSSYYYHFLTSGQYRNGTSPIDSLAFASNDGSFLPGSQFQIYGVR